MPNVTRVASIQEAYAAVEPGREAFIFGGGQVYATALDSADKIFATEMDTVVDDADTFFPELGPEWHEVSREHHEASEYDAFPFDFVTYCKA